LKRLYVRMRSFPQARVVSELLLAIDPTSISELRDRGLLAYHLEDYPAALRDLESYCGCCRRGRTKARTRTRTTSRSASRSRRCDGVWRG
jgi:regulator of sirC expression with transglutaminase-like and TPR domain